jgi:hypothetical protein
MDDRLSDASEDELYHLIGNSLLLSMPEGWQAVTYCLEIVDDEVWEESALVQLEGQGEQSVSLRRSKGTMLDAFVELERRMGEAGHEKWRKALYSMTADGKFAIDFVYSGH